MKTCKECNKDFESSLENFYKNKKSKDGLHSYCKECAKKKSKKWMEENDSRYRQKMSDRAKRRRESEKGRDYQRAWSKQQKESGYFKEWQERNKDKISEYADKRAMHKKHEISNEEWERCKQYFHYSCAYCGISEDIAVVDYGQHFHKEHVDHEGDNDISNCVPSCKSCNSKKWKHKFEDWYNIDNEVFDNQRFEKILTWLNFDYLD